MIKNYLKIAWRNLVKHRTFTLINILGLSVAFGVSILLGMAAHYDLSYDRFHERGDSLYQVYKVQQTPNGSEVGTTSPVPLAEALKEELPGIARISRHLSDVLVATKGEKQFSLDAVWVDPDFFGMFSFPMLNGGRAVLRQNEVVITEKTALKFFGRTNVEGETMDLLLKGRSTPFTVASVLQALPSNSSLEFEMALYFADFPEYLSLKDQWDSQNHEVYMELDKQVSPGQFQKSTLPFVAQHYKGTMESAIRDGAVPNSNGNYFQLGLLPIKDVHFADFGGDAVRVVRTYPYLLLGVAFLIMLIACVNFINMGIANSVNRLREIGMRKTLGAPKKQLFFQLWSESLLVFVCALCIGTLLGKLLLKPFQTTFQTVASFKDLGTASGLLISVVSVLFISFVAGGYPAILMSRLDTLQALKGKLQVAKGNRLRNALIVVQFCIAIALISSTLVLRSQLRYMANKDLGYNKEQVLAFPINGKKDPRQAVQLLREELLGGTDILSITAADNILGRGKDGSAYTSVLGFEYKGHGIKTNMLVVDHDYVETLDLKLLMGRSFSREFATDTLSVVVNETMARQLDEEDPTNARITLNDSIYYTVIGVLKDYHFQKLDRAIEPLTLFMEPDWELYYAYVKIAPGHISDSYDRVKNAWAAIEPNAVFMGSFLDENVDRTFQKEQRMAAMIGTGSVIAIILSCIGLFAMSLLIVSQRTKEIGIRKIVGASIASITFMLTKDFLKLVAISFVIASPLAWWFLGNWLESYAYKIPLDIWFFVAAGILAVGIAFVSIASRTIGAALQNPSKSLRTE
jgi:ABC-type antimicrobial peptide transport system permease subunit